MTRRSFVQRLGIAVVGLAAGASILSDSCTAKAIDSAPKQDKWRINPAWVNAPYEAFFSIKPDNIIFYKHEGWVHNNGKTVPRYVFDEEKWTEIYPFEKST